MNSSRIKQINALEILDSRGYPTIKTTVTLESGISGSASVPSGASTGKFEATELRDNDPNRFLGKGVLKAVRNVNEEIAEMLIGIAAEQQREIDSKLIALDNTENKSRLGANAILSVSLAVARAAANNANIELYKYLGGAKAKKLPVPMCNVINGGMHASNNLDIQEFMIVPLGASSFSEGLRVCVEVFHHLKNLLLSRKKSITVGDEGGFAPNLENNKEALAILDEAVSMAGYKDIIKYALDAATSEWLDDNDEYRLPKANIRMPKDKLLEYWEDLINDYPILSIEDAAGEEDWALWQIINSRIGDKIQLVGDDLFVTNTTRLAKGIKQKAANSILIKPNQIGTLTETIEAIEMAKRAGFTAVMSHRSGETEDPIIADLAVGLGVEQIKTGSLSRSERTVKYNRLLEIEAQLGKKAEYFGRKAFKQ